MDAYLWQDASPAPFTRSTEHNEPAPRYTGPAIAAHWIIAP
jgi:hypothetical protein